jgi:DNA-binding MarR family transcriptional regulator
MEMISAEPQSITGFPIGAIFAAVGRASTLLITEATRPLGLKPRHLPALMALEAGPMSQQALGAAVQTDPTQLVVLLNELEAGGIIARRRDAANRRRHIVELTTIGQARQADAQICLHEIEERLLGGIGSADRAELRRLLALILINADTTPCAPLEPGLASTCDT